MRNFEKYNILYHNEYHKSTENIGFYKLFYDFNKRKVWGIHIVMIDKVFIS